MQRRSLVAEMAETEPSQYHTILIGPPLSREQTPTQLPRTRRKPGIVRSCFLSAITMRKLSLARRKPEVGSRKPEAVHRWHRWKLSLTQYRLPLTHRRLSLEAVTAGSYNSLAGSCRLLGRCNLFAGSRELSLTRRWASLHCTILWYGLRDHPPKG